MLRFTIVVRGQARRFHAFSLHEYVRNGRLATTKWENKAEVEFFFLIKNLKKFYLHL